MFLDTQYHFAETLWYVERVRERYDLNLTVMEPLVPPDDLWQTDPDECCAMRKVEPLARALVGKQAWMTGLRRVETAGPRQRADRAPRRRPRDREGQPARAVDRRRHRGRTSATTSCSSTRSPSQGYPSIGCWPCTRSVHEGDDPRAGRWAGRGKDECGLHGWPEP